MLIVMMLLLNFPEPLQSSDLQKQTLGVKPCVKFISLQTPSSINCSKPPILGAHERSVPAFICSTNPGYSTS